MRIAGGAVDDAARTGHVIRIGGGAPARTAQPNALRACFCIQSICH